MVIVKRGRSQTQLEERFFKVDLTLFQSQEFEATTFKQVTLEVRSGEETGFNDYRRRVEILVQPFRYFTAKTLHPSQNQTFVSAYQVLLNLALEMANRAVLCPDVWVIKTRNSTIRDELLKEEAVLDHAIQGFCRDKLEQGIEYGALPANKYVGIFGPRLHFFKNPNILTNPLTKGFQVVFGGQARKEECQ